MNYPEVVVGAIILNKDDKVLICRSTKYHTKYIIPGGHIEIGESMEEALIREVKEETGLDIYDLELFSLKDSVQSKDINKHFIFIDFLCRTDSSEVILNDELDHYDWISLDEIDNYDIGAFVKILLEELRDRDKAENIQEIFYGFDNL